MDKTEFSELMREEKKEYFKNWRNKNKDKVKQYNETYWKNRTLKKLKENK